MKFYAFGYTDGTNTTTGGDYGVKLHIAGRLLSFSTQAARDAWVAAGYNVRVPRDVGEFRRAVESKRLPMGWRCEDAQDVTDTCREADASEAGL